MRYPVVQANMTWQLVELGSFNLIFTYFYQLEHQSCKIEVAKSRAGGGSNKACSWENFLKKNKKDSMLIRDFIVMSSLRYSNLYWPKLLWAPV
jgi:hypothetical protein